MKCKTCNHSYDMHFTSYYDDPSCALCSCKKFEGEEARIGETPPIQTGLPPIV